MRKELNSESLGLFFEALGRRLKKEARVYICGGASAISKGWRESSVDLDLYIVPDNEAFSELSSLKKELSLNIELASPTDFIPALPGWEVRSEFIDRFGRVQFFHFDFYCQALSKIERGLGRDHSDVRNMLRDGLVELEKLRALFEQVKSDFARFPAIDPDDLEKRLQNFK